MADCLEAAADDHGMLAEALDGGEPPPGILAELKPGLTGIVLDRVVAAARMLRRPVDRVGCLIVLGALLPEEGRQALCSEAADIASLIEDGFGRARALTELASHVPPDTAAALLRIALRAGRSIGDDPHQFHALSSILRLLPGTARERFAPELRRRLGTLKAGAARSALVVALFECTPAHDRDALVMDELALVIGVDDESVLASALVGLAPMLSDEQCMIAWRTAAAMRDAGERAKAIEALISRLPMEELVSTFRDQSRSNLWVPGQLLCSLAERLPVELVPELIARGREYAARRQVADMLIAAAGRLPPHERPLLLREAIDIAREYGLQLTLAQALTASVACRTEDQRNSVLREALDAVMSIGSQFGVQRMQALVKLVPVLPMTMYGAVLSDVSWVAADDDCYAAALGALRSLLPDDVLTGLINSSQDQPNRFVLAAAATAAAARPQLLDKAIVLAETQLAPRARCRALAAIVPHLDATLQKSVMASFVSSAAHLERRDLLPLIQSLLPVVAGCEGSDGISDVAQGILDVGDWFQ